jgi:uncharacterized delta-60 repeat protein
MKLPPRLNRLVFSVCSLVLASGLWAQNPGALDTSFDPGSGVDGTIYTIALQADGKVLVGGEFWSVQGASRFRFGRFNADGAHDTAYVPPQFGSAPVMALGLQSDGRAIVGGMFTGPRSYVVRLALDGGLDTAFGTGAAPDGAVRSLAVRPNDQIVIGGSFTKIGGTACTNVARLNADGTLDTLFSANTPGAVYAVIIQPDGKVFIAGEFSTVNGVARQRLARLSTSGAVDTSFAPGTVAGSTVTTVAVQNDSKVVFVGGSTTQGGKTYAKLVRLLANGAVDTAFSALVWASSQPDIYALVVQPDGKILIGGNFTEVNGAAAGRIARLNADGTTDLSLNAGAGANSDVTALALGSDDKVLIAGAFSTVDGVARKKVARLYGGRGTPPVITQPPTNQAVAPGGTATFTVTVSGTPPFSYQWKKEGQILAGQTNVRLTISPVTAADAGFYNVLVSNAVGAVNSSVARLIVAEPLVITEQPQSQTVAVGGKRLVFGHGDRGAAVELSVAQGWNQPARPDRADFEPQRRAGIGRWRLHRRRHQRHRLNDQRTGDSYRRGTSSHYPRPGQPDSGGGCHGHDDGHGERHRAVELPVGEGWQRAGRANGGHLDPKQCDAARCRELRRLGPEFGGGGRQPGGHADRARTARDHAATGQSHQFARQRRGPERSSTRRPTSLLPMAEGRRQSGEPDQRDAHSG